jgi:Holliday junction resolvase-like predicted endonuclease
MRPNNFELGRKAEDSVLEEYLEKGFTLLAKNFEVYSKDSRGRRAEIDLIMFKNNMFYDFLF